MLNRHYQYEYIWNMKLKNTLKYHILLGFIIITMDIFRAYVTKGSERFLIEFDSLTILYKTTFYIAFFSVYIINIRFICPKTLAKKNLTFFILGQISLFFVFAGIRYFIEEIVVYSMGGFHNYHDSTRVFWYYVFDNSYYSLQVILFSTFIYLLLMFLKNSTRIHKLQLEHQKAELGALKMQLEPHFLFNTLNVFYTELVETQPETAKGIHKLSELLRHLTYEGQKDYIQLKKELKFINDYIFFYEKRFENNLYLDFKIDGEIGQQEVPSLVLIHFIENIFKHGITNDKNNPAQISIKIEANSLTLETKNKVSTVKNYSSNGIGRENLKKRLHLIFQDDYSFTHHETDNFYSSYLKIPLK